MTGPLAELWEWGFEFGGEQFEWGTLVEEVASAVGLEFSAELALRGGEVHGLPLLFTSAWAPQLRRPVTTVTLELGEETRVHEDDGLAALRERLDSDVGPGKHEWVEKEPTRARSRWTTASTTIGLQAHKAAFPFNWGKSPGRLVITGGRERLAAPFLPVFHGDGEPWATEPGELEILDAPGLRSLEEAPWNLDAVGAALGRPELRATPAWVRERLGRHQVGIWRHRGTLGLCDRFATLLVDPAGPPTLVHLRVRRGRGPGWAEIRSVHQTTFLVTEPQESGLDRVADRLRELGMPVEAGEEVDWG